MRPFTSTITIDEARARLTAGVRAVERTEQVPLDRAGGRVAAADIAATVFVPPFSRSAMDGYAVVAADTATATREHPVRLRIVERVFTGHTSTAHVDSQHCAEIATGAPLPSGADAVVMVEETSGAQGDYVSIFAA